MNWDLEKMYRDFNPKETPKKEEPVDKFDRQKTIDAIKKIDERIPELPKIISAFKIAGKIDLVLNYKGKLFRWNGSILQTNADEDSRKFVMDWINHNEINYVSI